MGRTTSSFLTLSFEFQLLIQVGTLVLGWLLKEDLARYLLSVLQFNV